MKYILGLFAAMVFVSSQARADEPVHLGQAAQVDLGIPDGLAVGPTFSPWNDWFRMNFAVTYNGLAPGFRVGATIDPLKAILSPTLTFEGGYSLPGTIPALDNSPSISYLYMNIHAGLDLGKQDRWRFFLHMGPSWISARGTYFNRFFNPTDRSIVIGEPTGTITILPAFKLGYVKYF